MHAYGLGFDHVAIGPPPHPERLETAWHWLSSGYSGEMEWMQASASVRLNPRTRWRDLQSVIVVAQGYATWPTPLLSKTSSLTISCYAWVRDYHHLLGKKLRRLVRWAQRRYEHSWFRFYVDTGPLPEKVLAAEVGLGWIGKHGNLIHPHSGSWFFLGTVLTNVPFRRYPATGIPDRCGSCVRCMDICPTRAIIAPGVVDARRCISYWTIEHPGPIPVTIRPLLGTKIFGCDDCQTVCPWNHRARKASSLHMVIRYCVKENELIGLIMKDETAFRRRFIGSPVLRLGYFRFRRNVIIALGNSGQRRWVPILKRFLAVCRDPVLEEHATWSLHRLEAEKRAFNTLNNGSDGQRSVNDEINRTARHD